MRRTRMCITAMRIRISPVRISMTLGQGRRRRRRISSTPMQIRISPVRISMTLGHIRLRRQPACMTPVHIRRGRERIRLTLMQVRMRLLQVCITPMQMRIGRLRPGSRHLSIASPHGPATFSNLSIDRPGRGCTLTATATGLTGVTTTALSVIIRPPVVNAGPDETVLLGLPYTLSASFSDPDNDGPSSYRITGGDGSSSSGTRWSQRTFTATHNYLLPSSYTIRVTVTDSHGAAGSDTKVLTVFIKIDL